MGKSGALAIVLLALAGPAELAHAQSVALSDPSPALPMRPAFDEPGKPDYVLGTGDKIKIIVYGEDDLGGTFQVDARGFVQLPLIGPIMAAGGTGTELGARYQSALSDGFVISPKVAVEVAQYRPFYVIGEINHPGQFDYANGISVVDAVALAGGYTIKAVSSSVYIRHANAKDEEEAPLDESTKVQPGDVVRVPATTFWKVMDVLSPITSIGNNSYIPHP
jgi:protein involved in polysaccharide export with SLBB domain